MCGRCCAWGGRSSSSLGLLRTVPRRIVLDIDDTFDRVHGGRRLRLFNAYYDDYGFQPIVVFDGEGRFVTTLLRPGRRPSGVEIRGFVRRLIGAIRAHWPKVEILLRADSHYAGPEVFDWCRANQVDWISAWPPTPRSPAISRRWRRAPPRASGRRPGAVRCAALRNSTTAAQSWRRVERLIARVEAVPLEPTPASSSPISKAGRRQTPL